MLRNHIYQFVDVNDCCRPANNTSAKCGVTTWEPKKTAPHTAASVSVKHRKLVYLVQLFAIWWYMCYVYVECGWMLCKYVETINGIRSRIFIWCWKIVPGDTDPHWRCCCTDDGDCRHSGILSNRRKHCKLWKWCPISTYTSIALVHINRRSMHVRRTRYVVKALVEEERYDYDFIILIENWIKHTTRYGGVRNSFFFCSFCVETFRCACVFHRHLLLPLDAR